jgi:hypothetical protein
MSRTTDVLIKAEETPWLLTDNERKFCRLPPYDEPSKEPHEYIEGLEQDPHNPPEITDPTGDDDAL